MKLHIQVTISSVKVVTYETPSVTISRGWIWTMVVSIYEGGGSSGEAYTDDFLAFDDNIYIADDT